MKNFSLLLLFQIICYLFVNAQPHGPLISTDTISFETSHSHCLRTDNSQHGSIWLIGVPSKTYFNSSYTAPNAIFTDTAYYPVNNYSYFDLIIKDTIQYGWHSLGEGILGFWHKYDTDTLRDGGFITISYDGGSTWKNMIDDTNMIAMQTTNFYSHSDTINGNIPAFSGHSNGWEYAQIYWFWFGLCKDGPNDSLVVRFNFKSDSINNNKEGWLIDQIFFNGYKITGNIYNKVNSNEIKVYPNPAKDILNIEFTNPNGTDYTFSLFDNQGKRVFILNKIRTNKILLNTSDLNDGVYFYTLAHNGKSETGKIIINKR